MTMDHVTTSEPELARSTRNPHSTFQIAGHPIHPMLIPFPVVFVVSTLFCDLAYWLDRIAVLERCGALAARQRAHFWNVGRLGWLD